MILLKNLTARATYSVRVAAFTRVGTGAYSTATPVFTDPNLMPSFLLQKSSLESWFFIFVAAFILALIVSGTLLIYLKKKQKTEKALGHFDGKWSTSI